MNGIFTLHLDDFYKGLVTAVLAGVVIALGGIVQQPGFDVFSVDWANVGHIALNAGIVTFLAYMSKNFLSSNDGKFAGKIG